MATIIVGAGEVGSTLAALLSEERRDVVVIDVSAERLAAVQETGDVHTLEGHGASPAILEEAGVRNAELLVAVTDSDEVNLIAAMTAKQLGVQRTVARVRAEQYLGRGGRVLHRNLMGIDVVVSPETVTAHRLADVVVSPGSLVEGLAGGALEALRLVLPAGSPALDKPLRELQFPTGAILVAVEREDRLLIPHGDDALREADRVTLFVRTDRAEAVRKSLGVTVPQPHRAVLVGGGRIGALTARLLRRARVDVWIIEADRRRAEHLSRRLDGIRVLHGDGTRMELLREEGVESADVFMAVTERDEVNVIAALLARELGVRRTVALVQKAQLGPAVEKFGITRAISPRLITASFILKNLRGGHVLSANRVADGRGEVLEMKVSGDSDVVGRSLAEMEFPDGAVVGAIRRGKKLFVPRGRDAFQQGDRAVVFALTEAVPEVIDLFD